MRAQILRAKPCGMLVALEGHEYVHSVICNSYVSESMLADRL